MVCACASNLLTTSTGKSVAQDGFLKKTRNFRFSVNSNQSMTYALHAAGNCQATRTGTDFVDFETSVIAD